MNDGYQGIRERQLVVYNSFALFFLFFLIICFSVIQILLFADTLNSIQVLYFFTSYNGTLSDLCVMLLWVYDFFSFDKIEWFELKDLELVAKAKVEFSAL